MPQTTLLSPITATEEIKHFEINRETYDHRNEERLTFKADEGLTEELVRMISHHKNEPDWMFQKRLEGLHLFHELKMPDWGPSLKELDLSKIRFFLLPDARPNARTWDDVPEDIKKTFDKLGIPEAEKKVLAGVGAQYESMVVYHNLKKEWEEQGVVFLDCDEAVQKYPELVKKYFMASCVPIGLHKFSALHAAVWSGGTFIYVPKGVKLKTPLQAYFRMNARKGGQFEHTLIIVDEGAEVQYIEGCSAPSYTENALHVGCVEIHVHKNARARYSSIENWSKNTYNLNTKRAIIHENGVMEWVNGNMGSKVTMLYPCSILLGDNSKSDYTGVAFAGAGQVQDTGAKVIHIGKNTSSTVNSKSVSSKGGLNTYRGLVTVKKGALNAKTKIVCDGLIIDADSKATTWPALDIHEETADCAHEATVGRISQDRIFYLMSRGLDEETATRMIVSGFFEPTTKKLPLEYAIELNRLIEIELEGHKKC